MSETTSFACTGCRYTFGDEAANLVTGVLIDCPNCEGETLARPLE